MNDAVKLWFNHSENKTIQRNLSLEKKIGAFPLPHQKINVQYNSKNEIEHGLVFFFREYCFSCRKQNFLCYLKTQQHCPFLKYKTDDVWVQTLPYISKRLWHRHCTNTMTEQAEGKFLVSKPFLKMFCQKITQNR